MATYGLMTSFLPALVAVKRAENEHELYRQIQPSHASESAMDDGFLFDTRQCHRSPFFLLYFSFCILSFSSDVSTGHT